MRKNVVNTFLQVVVVFIVLLGAFHVHAQGIGNPLGTTQTIGELIQRVTQGVLTIASALAVLAIVIGGVRFFTAVGREDEVVKAKRIIMWAVAGLVVVLLAGVIVNAVINTLTS